MKLFVLQSQTEEFDRLTSEIVELIIKICERLLKRARVDLVHIALFLFHCEVKIATYHRFDRFIYACGAILVASKITDNLQYYPVQIIKAMRMILRQKKGIENIEDDQEKLKFLTKKMFEAEVTIMINIGFDFDIQLGLFWVQQWATIISDGYIVKKVEQTLTSLYQTNIVIYFAPELLALTAVAIVMKNEGISLELSTWDPNYLSKLRNEESKIKEIKDLYLQKMKFHYK